MEYKSRISYLRDQMSKSDIDTLFISNKDNIRYYSGFTGTFAFLLISESKAIIITDSRYTLRAEEESPDYEIYNLKSGDNWIENSTNITKTKLIGYEGDYVSVNLLNQLQKKAEKINTWKDFSEKITSGRIIKSNEEVEILQKTIDISDSAFNNISKKIKTGMTEKDVAWEIEKEMRELGAESPSFDTIVASGINGSKPHHSPTDKLIDNNEAITIDMGAKYKGYCSDLTRTIFIGDPNEKFKKIYTTVLKAQLISMETAQPDMTGEEIDKIARDIITSEGYGEYFGHSLGHGVGIEIHENPGVGPNSKNNIKPGMVYTIEPGIYIENWGGIRIEDMVIMTEGGNNLLSHALKEAY
ncbi:MAG: aminopeptidase P family protein [Chloroflexota bacterium]|nr:aminopeptidase P family protein [Chloroflexota bacterium]